VKSVICCTLRLKRSEKTLYGSVSNWSSKLSNNTPFLYNNVLFWRWGWTFLYFLGKNVLKMFIYMVYSISIYQSGHDQMTLMVWKLFWNELLIRTADYYKLRCVSCNKKTIVNVIQNMPLTTWVNLHFLSPLFCPYR